MKLMIINTSYERKSLKPINGRVIGVTESKEDEYYQPLIVAFYNKIKNDEMFKNDKANNRREEKLSKQKNQ